MGTSRVDYRKIRRQVEHAGLRFVDRGNGHIQVIGFYLVNYWPESRRKTVQVDGRKGEHYGSLERVIKLASQPKRKPRHNNRGNRRRRKSNVDRRLRLFDEQNGLCHWCRCTMTVAQDERPTMLTVDHVIPWSKGGSDDDSNTVAACFNCNQLKGDQLPAVMP